jgi:cytochrome c nitrite reductase small subunit
MASSRKKLFFSIGLGTLYLTISTLIGAAGGLGAFTFGYAKGASYLSNDAAACANCHVMKDQFDAWAKSSHGKFATCNDCHAPHDFLGKYACKGRNGFFHSLAFTTGNFHEPITINAYNKGVVEHACRDCHAEIIHQMDVTGLSRHEEPLECTRCHRDVGHAH